MLGKLLVSSSVLIIYFVSLVAMHVSAMAPAMIASAHVTTEALMCFHDNAQSNAAMHDLNGLCYPCIVSHLLWPIPGLMLKSYLIGYKMLNHGLLKSFTGTLQICA